MPRSSPRSEAAARIAPFALFIVLLALEPVLARVLPVDARWITVARGFLVGALLLSLWPRYAELRPLGALTARELALGVASGLAVLAAWLLLDRDWASFGSRAGGFAPLRADGGIDAALAAGRWIGFALVVPVVEELFWRSFLLRWIDTRDFTSADPRTASLTAFALCSALFASEHSMWLAGLVAGMAYNTLYIRTGNLRIPLISHATTNGTLGLWILATGDWHLW